MKCSILTINKNKPCRNKGTRTHVVDGWEYLLCGVHYELRDAFLYPLNTVPERRRRHLTTAVLDTKGEGTEHINLATGTTTTQEELPMENRDLVTEPSIITFYGIKGNGFKVEDGVRRFWWHRSFRETCVNDAELIHNIVLHFQQHQDTKWIVARIWGQYHCFKRDLTHAQMTNCVMVKSRFAL